MRFEIHWQTRSSSGNTPPIFDSYDAAQKIVDRANGKWSYMKPTYIYWWVVAVFITPPISRKNPDSSPGSTKQHCK